MTSDSITEQAARLTSLDLTVTRGLIASRGWIGGDLATTLLDEIERLTAALAHQAPATEDEAAEVEWGVMDPSDVAEAMDNEHRARTLSAQFPGYWRPVYRIAPGPWVEVASPPTPSADASSVPKRGRGDQPTT